MSMTTDNPTTVFASVRIRLKIIWHYKWFRSIVALYIPMTYEARSWENRAFSAVKC